MNAKEIAEAKLPCRGHAKCRVLNPNYPHAVTCPAAYRPEVAAALIAYGNERLEAAALKAWQHGDHKDYPNLTISCNVAIADEIRALKEEL